MQLWILSDHGCRGGTSWMAWIAGYELPQWSMDTALGIVRMSWSPYLTGLKAVPIQPLNRERPGYTTNTRTMHPSQYKPFYKHTKTDTRGPRDGRNDLINNDLSHVLVRRA